MSNPALYEEIVLILQKVVFEPSYWSTAFALIDEFVGVQGSTTVFAAGENSANVRIFLFWCYVQGQRHHEWEERYLRDYYTLDERVPRVRRLPERKLVNIKDLYNERELKNSLAYNEAMAVCNGQNSLHVRLAGPNDSRITWVPNDPDDREGWSSQKFELIRNLLPHLHHSICAQHSLTGAGILNSTLTGLLDATGIGTIQLDSQGRILDVNDHIKNLLRDGRTLFDREGRLYASGSQNNRNLQKLLSRAIPTRESIGYGGTMTISRWPRPPILVHAHPVQVQDEEPRTWPVAALVVINDVPSRPDINLNSVARTLNLTGMESRIAVMLAEGKQVPSIANELDRKESTVRHHIKRMFLKHNVSRQAELVDLVRSVASAPKI